MKQSVSFFLSYAHADKPDVDRFLQVLNPLLKISPKYEFQLWQDTAILPGEEWREEIDTALKSSRFGLLCISPQFLASKYITETELPALLAKPLIVPIGLHEISFAGDMDLKGLENRQLYRDTQNRTFDGCVTKRARRAFALDLSRKLGALLEKYPC